MELKELFPMDGREYNVWYTRFPNEVVPCRGKILKIEDDMVKFIFTTGTFAGSIALMSILEFFWANFDRVPLHN